MKIKKILAMSFALFFACSLIGCNTSKAPNSSSNKNEAGEESESISTEWDGLGELATPENYDLRIKVDSSAIAGLQNNLLDYQTNNSSVWFSGVSGSNAGEHYAVLDLGAVYNVHKVGITPYLFTQIDGNGAETQLDEISCFAKDIAIAYCVEEGKYSTAYSLDDYIPDYTVKTNANGTKYATDQEFGFGGYVTARYIKVIFSDMTDDKLNNYLVKLCSLKAYITQASELDEAKRVYEESLLPEAYENFVITASSVNDADPTAPFKIEALYDGNYGSYWCAEWLNETSPDTDEYLEISSKNGEVVAFTEIVLVGLPNNESMPVDFEIQYQIDGAGFVTAQSFTDYVNPRGEKDSYNIFKFESPIFADTLRVQFMKKSISAGGFYVVLLGEVTAKANAATAEEIQNATTAYQAVLGQEKAATETPNDQSFLRNILIASIAVLVVGSAIFFIPVKKKEACDEED